MLRAGREVGVQPEHLAERDVDAPEALPDGCGDRPLERDLVALDGLEDVVRQRRAVLRHDGLAGVDDLPVETHTGRVEDASRSLRQLRTDAVAGDEGDSVGHGPIVSGPPAAAWPAAVRGEAASAIVPSRPRG